MFPSTLQGRLECSPDPNYLSIRWNPYAIFHFSPLLGAILQHPAALQSQQETLSYLILSILLCFSPPLLPLLKERLVKIYCGWDSEARIPLNLMGTEHLNPLGSLKISASITNALLIITRFVHDSSGALTVPPVMWLCRWRHPLQAALFILSKLC